MGGGGPLPYFFCMNLLVRVKLGYPPNFNFLGKPLLGEKYVEEKKKKKVQTYPTTHKLEEFFFSTEDHLLKPIFQPNITVLLPTQDSE